MHLFHLKLFQLASLVLLIVSQCILNVIEEDLASNSSQNQANRTTSLVYVTGNEFSMTTTTKIMVNIKNDMYGPHAHKFIGNVDLHAARDARKVAAAAAIRRLQAVDDRNLGPETE